MSHWVLAPILLPLVGALILLLPFCQNLRRQHLVMGVTLLSCLVSLQPLARQALWLGEQRYLLGNWPEPFGIVLQVDLLSCLFIFTSTVLAVAVWVSLWRQSRVPPYSFPLLLMLLMGIHGAFLTADLFNLFVFFEILLMASYGLAVVTPTRMRLKAAFPYVVVNLVGSAVFLLALALLYALAGSLNWREMGQALAHLPATQQPLAQVAVVLLVMVFALKAALFPLHAWLVPLYSHINPRVAAMFAVMSKIGIYALIRLYGEWGQHAFMFPAWWLLAVGGFASLLIAALLVVTAKDLQQLVSCLVLMSAGTMAAALAYTDQALMAAVVFYALQASLTAALAYLAVDWVQQFRGRSADRLVVGVRLPPAAVRWFLLIALALVGMPPVASFVGKIWLVIAAMDVPHGGWLVLCLLLASGMSLLALARAGSVLCWQGTLEHKTRVSSHGWAMAWLLGLLMYLLLDADRWLRWCQQAVAALPMFQGVP